MGFSTERTQHRRSLWTYEENHNDAGELSKFLEPMKVLREVVDKNGSSLFDGVSCFLFHHLTREVLGTIEALRQMGCKDLLAQFSGYNPVAKKRFAEEFISIPTTELQTIMLALSNSQEFQLDKQFNRYTDPSGLPMLEFETQLQGLGFLESTRVV